MTKCDLNTNDTYKQWQSKAKYVLWVADPMVANANAINIACDMVGSMFNLSVVQTFVSHT